MSGRAKGKARVFLVDDHPLVREWLAGLLRMEAELEVCGQAEDASGALAAMGAAGPDVAIVDISLKGDSGLDLIKDIRIRFPRISIVVLSMHEEIYFAERAMRAGASGYVTKRESTVCIVAAIRKVLQGGVYASAEMMAQLAGRMIGRAPPPAGGEIAGLSDREIEVFQRLGQGHTTRRIAADLKVSMKTVQAYSARIKGKLGLSSGTELTHQAVRWVENGRRN